MSCCWLRCRALWRQTWPLMCAPRTLCSASWWRTASLSTWQDTPFRMLPGLACALFRSPWSSPAVKGSWFNPRSIYFASGWLRQLALISSREDWQGFGYGHPCKRLVSPLALFSEPQCFHPRNCRLDWFHCYFVVQENPHLKTIFELG